MRHGDYDATSFYLWREVFVLLSSEFLWIDVLGVKKEVAQREQAARAERNGGRQQPCMIWCFVGAYKGQGTGQGQGVG